MEKVYKGFYNKKTMIAMNKPIETKEFGNISIQLFNQDIDLNKKYTNRKRYQDILRFELVKIPLNSFSYNEFMKYSNELINLTEKYQGIKPEIKILGLNSINDEDILSRGRDDEEYYQTLNGRSSFSFENFSREDYKKAINPQLTLKSKSDGDSFMVCLTTSKKNTNLPHSLTQLAIQNFSNAITIAPKKRLSFYGQDLKPDLLIAIVKKYHKSGLTYSLNNSNYDEFV